MEQQQYVDHGPPAGIELSLDEALDLLGDLEDAPTPSRTRGT